MKLFTPPSSTKIKIAWGYTSTPPYIFIVWCLVQHRGNFTIFNKSVEEEEEEEAVVKALLQCSC
jgi:hypothetical protein